MTDPSANFLYVELADHLEGQIRGGVYRPGEKLPSIRKLHAERGVAIMTVSKALATLEERQLVEARPRSGYYVAAARPVLAEPVMARHQSRPRKVPLPHVADEFVAASANPELVPLGGAVLSPDLIPLKQLTRLVREVVSDRPDALARYGPPAGSPRLRRATAKRLLSLGLAVGIDDVVVSSGCMDAIRLALMALTRRGDAVAIETPTFFGFLQLVRDLGLLAVEVPTDPRTGIDLGSLDAALTSHDIRAVLVTPNFQNPTGALMPDGNKDALVRLAKRHRVPLIEDDVYGDLHFGPRRPRPLASFASGGDIIYCSSFSKTLAPGLRVGYVVPGRHLDRTKRLKLSGTITSPLLNQLVIAEMLEQGSYDRHLRRLRAALKTQMVAGLAAIARHFPEGTQVTSPEGGFLLWLQLARGVDSLALHIDAARKKISVLPGPLCTIGKKFNSCLRLSTGYPWNDALERGVRTLGRLAAA